MEISKINVLCDKAIKPTRTYYVTIWTNDGQKIESKCKKTSLLNIVKRINDAL